MRILFACWTAGCSILMAFAQLGGVEPADLAARLPAAKFEPFAKAPGYSEGPTWSDGELFFCSGALLRVGRDGKVIRYLGINPAGTVLRGNRHLLICDNKHKALLDLAPDGTLSIIADQFDGKPLNSLNDLTIDARGNVWWTDPAGSSAAKPVGNVFRLRPDGVVTRVATGLAFPNGIEVDPKSEFLYVIESQSQKVLRYQLPGDHQSLGKPEVFFDLGGSGGDGCAFDADGNLWVADFRRPETKRGRITVLSPAGKALGHLDVPAEVVSNITFGGANHDEIFCTTGNPPGVFRARVGVKGFAGHPGKPLKTLRTIAVAPEEPASPVHPRRFGFPGGVGPTRGWYVWREFDPEAGTAEVSNEASGQKYTVRVLPWLTTYRHLVYGAYPDELLPGERVNLFFAPDDKQQRAYLVHLQDELCQMKGHGHAWEMRSAGADGGGFTARVVAGDKPLDDKVHAFQFAAGCRHWRDGKLVDKPALRSGDRLYLTWVYQEDKRLVQLTADDASLESIKKKEAEAVAKRLSTDGLAGFVEGVDGETVQLLIFPTYWSQAGGWKEGQAVALRETAGGLQPTGEAVPARVLSRKNLGRAGAIGAEVAVQLDRAADSKRVQGWLGGKVIRVSATP